MLHNDKNNTSSKITVAPIFKNVSLEQMVGSQILTITNMPYPNDKVMGILTSGELMRYVSP